MNENELTKKKKATNRDVAKLAGVSVATVSYVVNGRDDQHISEQTKKKVYQAINFLNYAPNPHAVGLNTEQLQNIIIRSSASVTPLMEHEILHFMRSFNGVCEANGYQLNYTMDKRAARLAASACICFDMPNGEFHALGDENYIPVIAVDSLINDPIFYQVTPDYDRICAAAVERFKSENFTYVCITPQNENIESKIKSVFKQVRFVSSPKDLRLALNENCVLLSQPSLFTVFDTAERANVFKYDSHLIKRSQMVMDCIFKALNRLKVLDEEHYLTVF